jgi:lipopolysaccharide export system protein LptC
MIRRLLPVLLAALVLALAATLLTRETDRTPPPLAGSGPDYFITGMAATETGLDGKILQRLEAERLTHFASDDRAVLVRPHLVVYEQPAPWHLHAARGQVYAGGERVALDGGVRLTRTVDGLEEIVTETLQLYPEKRIAETDDPITYQGAGRTVHAIGMEASLTGPRVLFKSEVRGTYAP